MTDPAHRPADAAAAVAVWFDRHAAAVGSYASRRVGSTVALDVVGETFRVALERFDSFDEVRGGERAWLLGIATNILRRHWRSEERRLRAQARSVGSEPRQVDPLVAVEESVDASVAYRHLVDAVAGLPADDYELLVLVAWERMSSREVAAVLGIPAGTVRSRLRRIRAHLTEGASDG